MRLRLFLPVCVALLLAGCGQKVANNPPPQPITPTPNEGAAKTPDSATSGATAEVPTEIPEETQPEETLTAVPAPADGANTPVASEPPKGNRTIVVNIVALDQPFFYNRLGAAQPGGMIYALQRDVQAVDQNKGIMAGNVVLRATKRARPIVLRANVGDALQINFTNLLSPNQPSAAGSAKTRYAGVHLPGLELLAAEGLDGTTQEGIDSDASWVGKNRNSPSYKKQENGTFVAQPGKNGSLAAPGETKVFKYYAKAEGTFLLHSSADTTSGGQSQAGMFGAINVQPQGAEWFRSQVTAHDLHLAAYAWPKKDEEKPVQLSENVKMSVAQRVRDQESKVDLSLQGRYSEQATLITVIPDKRTEHTSHIVNVDGRVYLHTGQPLVNYNAIYPQIATYIGGGEIPDGLPVLKMLKINDGGELANYKLPQRSYTLELKQLASGIIPDSLREKVFVDRIGIRLSIDARVTDEGGSPETGFRWLITDPNYVVTAQNIQGKKLGTTFLVQAAPVQDANQQYQLRVSKAILELVHTDLTALITGPNAGRFPYNQDSPSFRTNPATPDRRQPYREFTLIYHQASAALQAFPGFFNNNPNLSGAYGAGSDGFGINLGIAGIGAEIVANRLGVGPMGNADGPGNSNDAVDLKYEEFFLSSWCVGDPAMIVDVPANANAQVLTDPAAPLPENDPLTGVQIKANPGDFVSPKGLTQLRPTKAFYPDDPSNVYHSYMRDHCKFRILHAGPGPSHVHHLHAHQWLHSPNSDDGHYLDSQLIIPGVAYTLEITYNGSGNRNQTVGDSIFHCHFYPHFAQGMWSLWRVHDVFESGTTLDRNGVPVYNVHTVAGPGGRQVEHPVYKGDSGYYYYVGSTKTPLPNYDPSSPKNITWRNRALPDGEIASGTPIPSIVPLPTLAMAPIPAPVQLSDLQPWYDKEVGQGRRVNVQPDGTDENGNATYKNPGYPFFVPGVAGHRAPHPPLDFAWKEDENGIPINWSENDRWHKKGDKKLLDGGLPRHVMLGGLTVLEYQSRWDFTKEFIRHDKDGKPVAGRLDAYLVPENGTPVELAAMQDHATRTRPSPQPNGAPGNFILNGVPPISGAPFARPNVNDDGDSVSNTRRYQAAVIQNDVVLNKKGWHYPQQRFITLWEDVADTFAGKRAPQPFFFRSNTEDEIEFWHTNLVPNYYELDDFQVRTPTDVIGQHIHLVKFDVTSSDGAANGFNYEDGTLGSEEVQGRIDAIMRPPLAGNTHGQGLPGLYRFDPKTGFIDTQSKPYPLKVQSYEKDYVKWVNGKPASLFGPEPKGQSWDGAQTTIQRWDTDPLLNNEGVDRTLRTVFTHDHFSPSTHQQVGLYAGLLVEPEDSQWFLPDGTRMNTRTDGGPTGWHGYIVTQDPAKSYREFAIEFQDMQLAYTRNSIPDSELSLKMFDPKLDPTASAAFYIGQRFANQDPNPEQVSLAAWIGLLNRKNDDGQPAPVLPQAFYENWTFTSQPGQSQTITAVFPAYGVPLTKNAIVTPVSSTEWTIQEPPGDVLNAGQKYIVKATDVRVLVAGTPAVATALSVWTPDIHAGWSDPQQALNPHTDTNNAGSPQGTGNAFGNGAPFPQLISFSAGNFGTYSMNYRNEPVPLRLSNTKAPIGGPPATAQELNLAYVFNSIQRVDGDLNVQPTPGTPINKNQPKGFKFPPNIVPVGTAGGAQGTDPYTPLLRAYANDNVQVRTLVGAHLQSHSFQIQGVKWHFEPSYTNSGYRGAQAMGLSEHFEMLFKLPAATAKPTKKGMPKLADYLYSPSSGIGGLQNGLWGIMRAYGEQIGTPRNGDTPASLDYLAPLPNNPLADVGGKIDALQKKFAAVKQTFTAGKLPANYKTFSVTATTAAQTLPGGKLVYISRGGQELSSTDAMLYVLTNDNGQATGNLKSLKDGSQKPEPLIIRVCAGDWIEIKLTNAFDPTAATFNAQNELGAGSPFRSNPLAPVKYPTTKQVSLHGALIGYDATQDNGVNVGFNQDQTIQPGGTRSFYWYAGNLDVVGTTVASTPVEFGATNLVACEMMIQPQFGMVGALIVEPHGSTWDLDPGSAASANVKRGGKTLFREFVMVGQNYVANSGSRAGYGTINYRTEPFNFRKPLPPTPTTPASLGYAKAFANSQLADQGHPDGLDPNTPLFVAKKGTPVRFRVLYPSTTTTNSYTSPSVLGIHGHVWQEEPYIKNSTEIGNNRLSQHFGMQVFVPYQASNLLFDAAGGSFHVTGDYLYHTYQQEEGTGTWGLFRVTD